MHLSLLIDMHTSSANYLRVSRPSRNGKLAVTTSVTTSMTAFRLVGICMPVEPSDFLLSSLNMYTLPLG
jgi:hypothetical protein